MRPYELFIEEEACWGCRACELACQQEHEFSFPPLLRVLEEGPHMDNKDFSFQFRVRVCRHCQDPECVKACPQEALYQRPDSIVLLDQARCNGCGLCQDACAYQAIMMDPSRGKALKCDMCHVRVDHGLYPACADNVCMAHCIYFDRPEHIRAQVDQKRARRKTR
ncbi:MAG: 4Fe-4S dicluster domain-containing protein [bacterium]